jgi:hypothetical protein
MKKIFAILALTVSTAVLAQSTVTISGQVQYGVARSAAGVTTVGAAKGDRNYLNFSAAEDLGGGTKVGIFLQNRFSSETGAQGSYANSSTGDANTQLWEQSNIFVDSKFGNVKLGRFSTQLVSTNGAGHYMQDWSKGTHSGLNYGRNSAQVQYTSPKIAGAEVFLLNAKGRHNKYVVVPGNGFATTTTATLMNDVNVIGVNYSAGGLKAQVANITGLNAEKLQTINAAYNFGFAEVAVNQMNQKDNLTSMAAHKSTEYGIKVPVNAKLDVSLSKLSNNVNIGANGAANTKKGVTGVRAVYSFSKRTKLEAFLSDTKQAVTAAGAADTANIGTASYIGLSHSF